MFERRLQVDTLNHKVARNEWPPKRTFLQERRAVFATCRENCHQYLVNTTLHGLKYVRDRKITRLERSYFALMFVLVIFLSIYFISNVWAKWNASPLIISLGTPGTSVKDFPFPAVTICNMNQARKSAVLQIPRTSKDYAVLQSICRYTVDENVTNSVDGRWNVFRRVLKQVAQPCEKMLVGCRYGGINVDCMDIFNSILTDSGLCCIFNGVHRKFMINLEYNRSENFYINNDTDDMANKWTPETGFESEGLKQHRHGYPKPGIGSGSNRGLSLILNAAVKEYYCSSTNGLGFKVLLHSPNELPEVDFYGLGVSNGAESRIVATPILTKASKAVQNMPMKIRQCIFESENFLTLYRIYSRRNCQSECETKIYFQNCNCVLYYMPRVHHNMTICGRSNAVCVARVKREMRLGVNDSFACKCPYGCHAIKYEMALSSTTIYEQAPLVKSRHLSVENTAILHIYYQSSYYRSQNKEELIGFTEFLSNMGGLLGLFMGFSVFFIVEVLYFLSIRPYCSYLKDTEIRQRSIRRVFQKIRNFRVKETSNGTVDNKDAMNNIVFPHTN